MLLCACDPMASLNIGPPSEMPHPQHDWSGFFALIRAGNGKQALSWDPLTKRPQVIELPALPVCLLACLCACLLLLYAVVFLPILACLLTYCGMMLIFCTSYTNTP